MAESTSEVYDIFHPTPVPLKQLSAIAVSLEIWRYELNKRRTSNKLNDFYPGTTCFLRKNMLPDLPSTIYDTIKEFVDRFGLSMKSWLRMNYRGLNMWLFHPHVHQNDILNIFDDFVVAYNGTIDRIRTAERMMQCDRFSQVEKFSIACMHCMENEIMRLWPSVCENADIDLSNIRFDSCPELFYWVCYLRNEMNRIPARNFYSYGTSILKQCLSSYHCRQSVEYFWLRIPLEKQLYCAFDIFGAGSADLVRYILPKFSDQMLGEFLNTDRGGAAGGLLMKYLFQNRIHGEWLCLPTWAYIKNKMNQDTITSLVKQMLKLEAIAFLNCDLKKEPENWPYFYSAIWNDIDANFKQSAIESIFPNGRLFENVRRLDKPDFFDPRCVEFLLVVLSSATSSCKREFWLNSWPHLIVATRAGDLQRVIKLCLEDEDEIVQFKANTLMKSDHVRRLCVSLLESVLHLDELNDFMDFCCPGIQAAREFKRDFLRSYFLFNDRWQVPCRTYLRIMGLRSVDRFSTFVDSAFDSVDLSIDFKNQLASSSVFLDHLLGFLWSALLPFVPLMYFVDTFASMEQMVMQIKARMIECLKKYSTDPVRNPSRKHDFRIFLLWCLGSEEEVTKFERTYIVRG